MKSLTVYVVMTPSGDRPYVSINKPQSYIDHLDASGEEAEVHEIEVSLAEIKNDWLIGESIHGRVFQSTRIR